jgi:hypothetical protein
MTLDEAVRTDETQTALDTVAYLGRQTTSSWNDEELENQIADAVQAVTVAYIDEHTRPGCECVSHDENDECEAEAVV